MGTSAIYGFYKNGIEKTTYVPLDGYPEDMGEDVVKFIKDTSIKEMNKIFDKIIVVKENSIITEEQLKECEKYCRKSINMVRKWNDLIWNSTGTLFPYKEELKYMIENKDYYNWKYIINLGNNTFEVYGTVDFNNIKRTYKIDNIPKYWYKDKAFKSIDDNIWR